MPTATAGCDERSAGPRARRSERRWPPRCRRRIRSLRLHHVSHSLRHALTGAELRRHPVAGEGEASVGCLLDRAAFEVLHALAFDAELCAHRIAEPRHSTLAIVEVPDPTLDQECLRSLVLMHDHT